MATVAAPVVRKPRIQHTDCFINGRWVPAASGKTFETVNPPPRKSLRKSPRATRRILIVRVKRRVRLSIKGLGRGMDARDRGRLMFRLAT